MALESVTNQSVNLKNIVLPDLPKHIGEFFDPKKEFSSEDWQWLKEGLSVYKQRGKWLSYLNLALSIKLMDQSRLSAEDVQPSIISNINDEILKLGQSGRKLRGVFQVPTAVHFYNLGLLTSGKPLAYRMFAESWEWLESKLAFSRKYNRSWDDAASAAVESKVFFPEKYHELKVDQDDLKKIEEYMRVTRIADYLTKVGDLKCFYGLPVALRILFPGIQVSYPRDFFSYTRKDMELLIRRGHINSGVLDQELYALRAVKLMLMSARELKMDGKGLTIVMQDQTVPQENLTELPIQRSF